MLPNNWFGWLRAVLELLYFVSGIGILAAAIFGFKQVRAAVGQLRIASEQLRIASEQLALTKSLAESSNKREAVKLAVQQCLYFAETVQAAHTALAEDYRKHQCKFLTPPNPNPNQPLFIVNDGKIVQANYDLKLIEPDWPKVRVSFVNFLNFAEGFAIPFASGVADEETGYRETGPAFCSAVGECVPAVYYLTKTQGTPFPSLLKLYNIWNNRLAANVMSSAVKGMQQFIDAASSAKIETI